MGVESAILCEVCSSREITTGFLGIYGGRAKIITGIVMVCCSRKVAAGCAAIRNSCSAGHYGLIKEALHSLRMEGFLLVNHYAWAIACFNFCVIAPSFALSYGYAILSIGKRKPRPISWRFLISEYDHNQNQIKKASCQTLVQCKLCMVEAGGVETITPPY